MTSDEFKYITHFGWTVGWKGREPSLPSPVGLVEHSVLHTLWNCATSSRVQM